MKPELMEKFKELKADVKEAIKLFGTYTFGDKGPDEVMDMGKWETWVATLSEEDAIEFANYVVEHDDKNGRLESVIDCLNDFLPESWWEGRDAAQEGPKPIKIQMTSLGDVLDEVLGKQPATMRELVIQRIRFYIDDAAKTDPGYDLPTEFGFDAEGLEDMGDEELLDLYLEMQNPD